MDKKESLKKVLGEFNKNPNADAFQILDALQKAGKQITLEDFQKHFTGFGRRSGEYSCPKSIVEFIIEYLSETKPKIKKIFDPWCGIGSILLPLQEKFNPKKVQGIYPNIKSIKIARSLYGGKNIDWYEGDPNLHLDTLDAGFPDTISCLYPN